jgi:hypothetical protein
MLNSIPDPEQRERLRAALQYAFGNLLLRFTDTTNLRAS